MKLKRFLLRYYPPGVILEYELRDKSREMKEIDLLHLTAEADVEVIVNQIVAEEPLISESKKPHLRKLLYSKLPAELTPRSFPTTPRSPARPHSHPDPHPHHSTAHRAHREAGDEREQRLFPF